MTGQKKPTEMLKEDHQNVLRKLDALEEVITHQHNNNAASMQVLT